MATKKEKLEAVLEGLGISTEGIDTSNYQAAMEELLRRGFKFKFNGVDGKVFIIVGEIARPVEKKGTLGKLLEAIVNELYE